MLFLHSSFSSGCVVLALSVTQMSFYSQPGAVVNAQTDTFNVHLMCCVQIFTLLVCSHLWESGTEAVKCCKAVLGNVWERRRSEQSPAEVCMSPQ